MAVEVAEDRRGDIGPKKGRRAFEEQRSIEGTDGRSGGRGP
jgi:hypothetical protein